MSRDPDIRASIAPYLDQLVEIYEITDPAKGADSQEAKLAYARHAIEIWWRIFDELMLWAQSQIAGYCLAKNDPEILERLPRLFGNDISENSHELEFLGLQYAWNPVDPEAKELLAVQKAFDDRLEDFSIETKREIVMELLVSRTANSSFWRFPLQTALRALNEGERNPFVMPSGNGKQGRPFSLKQWKLEALRQVYFRVGKGFKKYRALQEVADGIGQSSETLRDWEKQLLRSEDYSNDLYCSQLAGALESVLKSGNWHSIPDYEQYGSHRGPWNVEIAEVNLRIIEKRTFEEIRENIKRFREPGKSGG
ncbi:MAG: hypothetical protein ACLP4V_13575 [Methylocella sp.]